jgi:hypothetical protein
MQGGYGVGGYGGGGGGGGGGNMGGGGGGRQLYISNVCLPPSPSDGIGLGIVAVLTLGSSPTQSAGKT